MIAQQILNGLVSGSVYALFALGLTLILGVYRVLNLAHGAVFMVGAFAGLFGVLSGLPLWLAVICAVLTTGLLGVLIDLVAIRPLGHRHEAEFAVVVSTIGVNQILINIAQHLSNTTTMRFPFGTFPVLFFTVLGLRISLLQIVIVLTVAVLLGLVVWYLYYTGYGRQVRAVAGNPRAAVLLGVSPRVVYFQTYFIAGALAGVAGVLIGLSFNSVYFLMGEPYMLRAFVVIVLGGLGNIPGAVLGGLLLGVAQTLTAAYLPSSLGDVIIFSCLFLVLLMRPEGLFSRHAQGLGADRR
ncbi:MAG: branched-chain amino acid ABC transporter permease [Rhizobiaceae bacterium]